MKFFAKFVDHCTLRDKVVVFNNVPRAEVHDLMVRLYKNTYYGIYTEQELATLFPWIDCNASAVPYGTKVSYTDSNGNIQTLPEGYDLTMAALEHFKKDNQVRIINISTNPVPSFAHKGDGAVDLYANISEPVTLVPNESKMIGSGIKLALPEGMVAILLPRSGTGSRGYSLANTIGLIDQGFRSEIMMNIKNTSSAPITIEPNMRVAQLMFIKTENPTFKLVESFDDTTERGEGGFGSTGV